MKKLLFLSLGFLLVMPLAVFAEDNTSNLSTGATLTITPPTVMTPVVYDGACASTVVIAHENAMQAITEVRQASMKTAASVRRDALGAAYLLSLIHI